MLAFDQPALGKRRADRMADPVHIPNATHAALKHIARLHHERRLMLSGTARMLDHLVIRDHITVDKQGRTIRFQPDGLAFHRTGAAELSGHAFTFDLPADAGWRVTGSEGPLAPRIEALTDGAFTLHFDVP